MTTTAHRVLFRFFLGRLFQSEAGRVSPGIALVLLALPGTIVSLLLMEKYSALARFGKRMFVWDPNIASLPDRYLFVVLAAVIAGCTAVLRLNALFPDRRDTIHLSSMPISGGVLTACRAAALATFILAVIVSSNIGSTVFFPAVVLESAGSLGSLMSFTAGHAAATAGAGVCAFSSVLAAEGTLLCILPFRWYRRAKRYVRFAMLAGFVGLLVSVPACTSGLRAMLNGERVEWLERLPTLWFLGVHVEVQGFAAGRLNTVALDAMMLTLGAVVLAALTWTLGSRWQLRRMAEHPADSNAGFPIADRAFRPLDRWLLQRPFERGCFRFVIRTLLRSDAHAATFSAILGVGAGLALLTLRFDRAPDEPAARGVLTFALMVLYSLLTALRVAFSVPAEPEAAWLFRIVSDGSEDPRHIAARILGSFGAAFLAISAGLLTVLYGLQVGLLHSLFTAVLVAAFVEVLTAGFRVLPFTCAWMPGRNNLLLGGAVWLAGLAAFGFFLGPLEASYLKAPWHLVWFVGLVAGLLAYLRRDTERTEMLVWQDTRGELDLLRLTE